MRLPARSDTTAALNRLNKLNESNWKRQRQMIMRLKHCTPAAWSLRLLWSLAVSAWSFSCSAASDALTLSWTNNLLTVSGPNLPGGKLEIWYPEAFCRKGSTDRDWGQTVLPQRTFVVGNYPPNITFETILEPEAEKVTVSPF